MASLQLWAGPECTVNRLGDRYRDQLELTGFAYRVDDLDRLAELGVRSLRFPVLWERTAPLAERQYDWQWSDERMQRLRDLHVSPIVGLMQHGSGPAYTNLLDAQCPGRLAEYARAVAERYPHVDAYTPLNEPVTTARFSALYGLWYPHRRDDRSFVRAVLHQIRGTVLAMRENVNNCGKTCSERVDFWWSQQVGPIFASIRVSFALSVVEMLETVESEPRKCGNRLQIQPGVTCARMISIGARIRPRATTADSRRPRPLGCGRGLLYGTGGQPGRCATG